MKKIEQDEIENNPPSKLKKTFILIIGIILLVLLISYLIGGYPLSDILRGQLESSPLRGDSIDVGKFKIIFKNGTQEQLHSYYLEEQKVEFSLCLQGLKQENEYVITSLYKPVQVEQAFDHVSFEPCSKDTLIMLHTHPYKSCLASDTDLRTLEKTKEQNSDVLMVVMCEPKRFSVYG